MKPIKTKSGKITSMVGVIRSELPEKTRVMTHKGSHETDVYIWRVDGGWKGKVSLGNTPTLQDPQLVFERLNHWIENVSIGFKKNQDWQTGEHKFDAYPHCPMCDCADAFTAQGLIDHIKDNHLD